MSRTIRVKVDCIPDPAPASASGGGGGKVKPLPHYKEIPITKDMAEGTKAFAEQYNAMRAVLLDNGLMKAK